MALDHAQRHVLSIILDRTEDKGWFPSADRLEADVEKRDRAVLTQLRHQDLVGGREDFCFLRLRALREMSSWGHTFAASEHARVVALLAIFQRQYKDGLHHTTHVVDVVAEGLACSSEELRRAMVVIDGRKTVFATWDHAQAAKVEKYR